MLSLTPERRYIPTGRKSCSRALPLSCRSIRSARTANWPVSKLPEMVVRHTSSLPGALKQNFCQSPYLICRMGVRCPRGAMSDGSLSLADGAACWPQANLDGSASSEAAHSEATTRRYPRIWLLLMMVSVARLSMFVEKLGHQPRPLWNDVR